MKRVIALILAFMMMLSLSACKTKEEQELEKAQQAYQQAKENADKARQKYDHLQDLIDQYDKASAALDNAN